MSDRHGGWVFKSFHSSVWCSVYDRPPDREIDILNPSNPLAQIFFQINTCLCFWKYLHKHIRLEGLPPQKRTPSRAPGRARPERLVAKETEEADPAMRKVCRGHGPRIPMMARSRRKRYWRKGTKETGLNCGGNGKEWNGTPMNQNGRRNELEWKKEDNGRKGKRWKKETMLKGEIAVSSPEDVG